MARASLDNVIRHLRRVLYAQRGRQLTDAELVKRYVSAADGAAFELMVWRHQRMVYGVCKRILRHDHDAEDAFQATFLVLARKAGSIGNTQSLAGWLYQVAYRVACRSSSKSAKRSQRERTGVLLADVPDRSATSAGADLWPVLDAEVQRLPSKYRLPVILCYLEGKSYDEAARQLGCPKGTVSTRLTRARELLREQLTRRGVTLSATAMAALAAGQASAAVPAHLLADTASLVMGTTTAAIPMKVVALSQGVILSMYLSKVKVCVTVAVTVAALGFGGGLIVSDWTPIAQAQVSQPAGAIVAPDGNATDSAAEWRSVKVLTHGGSITSLAVSPDSRRLAVGGEFGIWDLVAGRKVSSPHIFEASILDLAFSPDGKYLAVSHPEAMKPDGIRPSGQVALMDVATAKLLESWSVVPDGEQLALRVWFEPGGKRFSAITSSGEIKTWIVGQPSSELLNRGPDTSPGWLARGDKLLLARPSHIVFSPDGKWMATEQPTQGEVWVLDGSTQNKLNTIKVQGRVTSLAVSPDGKRLAAGGLIDSSESVRLWDIASGRLIWSSRLQMRTSSIAFSPDGKLVATGGQDQSVRLWDAATGKAMNVLRGHNGSVLVVIFTTDGRQLISAGSDGTIRVWEQTGVNLNPRAGAGQGNTSTEGDVITYSHRCVYAQASLVAEKVKKLAKVIKLLEDDVRKLGDASAKLRAAVKVDVDERTNQITISGPADIAARIIKLINVLDRPVTAPSDAAPGAFDHLIATLIDGKRSDEQALEAICLATLGRLPSEVESGIMAKHLASAKDRRKVLGDLVFELVHTREFQTHVESLLNLVPVDRKTPTK
jgi:RNA polymerase sigma factor (sigma-70 family)